LRNCILESSSRKGFHNYLLTAISELPGVFMVNSKRQYRSRIQIAADILEIAKNGSRKTRIMYLGNLSFDLLQKYLDMLVNFGLLEARGGSEKSYVATEKGRHFLEDYRELRRYSEMAQSRRRALEAALANIA